MTDNKRAAERMRFEAVYAFPSRLPVDRTVSNERYCSMETENAFRAWQAALSSGADGGKDSSDEFRRAIEACRQVSENSGGAQYNMFGKDLAEQCAEAIAAIAGEKK